MHEGNGMTSDFDAFHKAVMEDQALQAALDGTIYPDAFLERAGGASRALGLQVDGDALRPRARARQVRASTEWAPQTWLPVGLIEGEGGTAVDWARFGQASLARSFYADSVAEAVCRPFNRVFRHSTAIDAFIDAAAEQPSAAPAGFVFHMSRCGSTLVAQMLGALDGTISLSEPGPLDAVVRFACHRSDIPRARHVALLRAMVGALARPANGEERCFVKLDSWHILALPLFREAFPEVPWLYLFREPVEVLVSQMRMRGYHTVPGLVPEGGHYLVHAENVGPELQCAGIFAQYHAAAIEGLQGLGGIAIDYSALPEAFEERIAPHFAIELSEAERRAVAARARQDSKAPDSRFDADGPRKRHEASAAVRDAAALHLAAPHAILRDFAAR